MILPNFITFTGVDHRTDPSELGALAKQYRIEVAFLFSPSRQGNDHRYPPLEVIKQQLKLLRKAGCTRFAAHLCGGYSRALMDHKALPNEIDALIYLHFDRVQVNGAPAHHAVNLAKWGSDRRVEVILQCPHDFPADGNGCSWLLDGSCGRGISPEKWPMPPVGVRRPGFAGGIGPDNAEAVVASIGARALSYWIDMETGVRDANDWFSVEKCRKVCEAVYGAVDTTS